MEKRLVDVALRHGLPDFTLDKWKAFERGDAVARPSKTSQ